MHNEVTYRGHDDNDVGIGTKVAFVTSILFAAVGGLGAGVLSPFIGRRQHLLLLHMTLMVTWLLVC